MTWGILLYVVAAAGALLLARLLVRRAARRAARRALFRFRARIDRYKLTRRAQIRRQLMEDPAIGRAVAAHAAGHALPEAEVRERAETYIDEIVPSFSVLAYYKFGYALSGFILRLLYRVTVLRATPDVPLAALRVGAPRDAVLVYLMNHRSNADYVLAGYALAGQVAISYAVGEWARIWPLEPVFKAFGAYFIRRRFREPLYHAVLERYVQLITLHGVTQGIFPEGGLTRDGKLRPAKIGLLDYILGVARDPAYRDRIHVVPVGINYDRVLEDRTLLRELAAAEQERSGEGATSRLTQLAEVARFLGWNAGRLLIRRWKRYGTAAVTIGGPVALAPWFRAQEREGVELFDLPRPARLQRVQALCDDMMERIGLLIPVTPVPLACAAVQSLGSDFIPRSRLLGRMLEMRDVLLELNARVIRAEGDIERTLDLALQLLTMRRALIREGEGFVVLPRNRPLISYYANSIAHLLGPFSQGVRERDALPALVATGEYAVPLTAGGR